MKNNRLNGIIILAIAVLVVGGLTYYEFTRLPPKETVLGNPPETDEPLSLGDQSTVPSVAQAKQEPAPAAGSTTAAAPTAPAASGTTVAAAPAPAAGTPAPAAGSPAPAATATAEAPANPPQPSGTATAQATTTPPSATGTATTPANPPPAATATAETPANPPPAATATAQAPANPPPAGTKTAEATANPPSPAVAAAQPAASEPATAAPSPGTDTQVAAAPTTTAPTAAAPSPAAPAAPAGKTATEAATNAPATGPAAPAAGQQVATAAPPPTSAAPGAPAKAAPPPVTPSFDIVRVEPSGDAVVAGTAAPQSKVEILDGPATVATATADDRGDWAMAFAKALKPGTHDLAIRTTSKDGSIATLSDQRVAVQVPKPGSKDVLVVLNSPDKPSRVLQLPKAKAPAASGGEQVATAAPPSAGGTTAAPKAPKTGGQVAAIEPKSPAAQSPDLLTKPSKSGATGSAPTASATPAPSTTTPAEKPAAPVVAEKPAPAKPALPKPEVAVSAVEADTAGTLFVAGTAATDQTVRVYLDDKPLGEAKPSPSGTWLVEVHHEVPPGTYKVRADQVSGPSGKVIARAEVPFDRKIDVANLKASGDTGAATGADVSGHLPQVKTVIIKRGDNLWTIARDTWGRGITWSTLYQANKDQIRNPHWIYPGQVFIMPASPNVAKN